MNDWRKIWWCIKVRYLKQIAYESRRKWFEILLRGWPQKAHPQNVAQILRLTRTSLTPNCQIITHFICMYLFTSPFVYGNKENILLPAFFYHSHTFCIGI